MRSIYSSLSAVKTARTYWHAAPRSAREDIEKNGIDFRRGNPRPIVVDIEDEETGEYEPKQMPNANYLYHNWTEMEEGYARNSDYDVYEVDVSGLDLEPDPYESVWAEMTYDPIPPERIRRLTDL